jgi:menaquinone-dependent protoporphyrinogen oxidase
MQLLVAYASKHGSTTGMAEAIGLELESVPATTWTSRPMAEVDRLGDYDAIVLGSAVYVGRWLPEATSFVEGTGRDAGREAGLAVQQRPGRRAGAQAGRRPGGPVGDQRQDQAAPSPRAPGKIDRSTLSFGEKVITSVVRAPEGDFRDWPAISEYAREIAAELGTE